MGGNIGREQLRAFIERIERLEEEKKAVSDDIKEVYAEAKANGYHTKVIRQIVRMRKQDANERAEQEAILDLYLHALGMIESDAGGSDIREPVRAARHDYSGSRNPVGLDLEG
ncbi:MAG TPA: DUF2312 domain-containing protein [Pelagibacterium sp.]|uniref:DUF2312 domain-containing protein n=1 Tax=Pelagibacterium sp. TaxID=1967288 RepID=UPI002BC17198|nr:DUF2312 domain-containing protein [Pelagibacterium sp.]HWJ86911.1 DUF2312 domain-containing protein [Pelagibacterium sp.]